MRRLFPTLVLALALAVPLAAYAGGVQYRRFETTGFSGHVITVPLANARLRLLAARTGARQPVKEIVANESQVAAVNASFFDGADRAMGLVVDDGKVISRKRVAAWGALVVAAGRARVVLGREVKLEEKPQLVVQGVPRLVVAGAPQKLKPQVARRTAVCADGEQVRVVVTSAVEANTFARFLAQELGCKEALNLDGGPSTQLELRLGDAQAGEPGQAVPNALVALPAPPR